MSARPDDLSSHLREAISTLTELRQERDELLRQTHEPIAVIGMGCRLPGGGSDPESFWEALLQGVDAVAEIPRQRWPPGTPRPTLPGTRWAGLLEQIDQFDARFFGISPRESVSLDPQQRLLLEVTWEALERACQPTKQLVGSRTGVFIGIMSLDYRDWIATTSSISPDAYGAYGATGNALCTAAGRISYILGMQGPCLSVDTACSSSLVAVHLACQSLRSGESTMAIVGGVNVIASSLTMQLVGSTQTLSPDGRCRTFDARANGTVRAEGCGVVILKRLSDARRAGDPIVGLIRGSAVNHDGRSTGFTAPSVTAQQRLLRQALDSAEVEPDQIGYIEAHGTATALGDPIELEALKAVLGQPRRDGSGCMVSSVKANLGHLEAAAGITGLLKTLLVLHHQRIPRQLHFHTLNPRVSLAGTPLVIPTAERSWPAGDGPRFAGISSFGLSGTNAHAVLEAAPQTADRRPPGAAREQALILSGKTEPALRALLQKYCTFLEGWASQGPADDLDIAYTAALRRTHYPHRLTVVGRDSQEWLAALSAFSSGQLPPGLAHGQAPVTQCAKIVFVFSGQGSQWLGMGKQLLTEEPVFRAAIAECEEAIQKEVGWSLTGELLAEPGRSNLARSEVMQPMVFAIAVALAKLYKSWGVAPDAVIGHSMGEVAAAHICGALSLADAVRIICRRSILMQTMSGLGAVAQLDATYTEAQQLLVGCEDKLAVAGANGPRSTVVSGELQAMEQFLNHLQGVGVLFRRVRMDVASHSPQMDGLHDGLLRALDGTRSRRPQTKMFSTVTRQEVDEGMLDAAYWYRNLREPVMLWPTVEHLRAQGYELFVEVSPHPVLVSALQDGLMEHGPGGVVLGSLRRQQPERRCLLETLGELFVRGCGVSWAPHYPEDARCVQLPTYPWQRERYWPEVPVQQPAESGPKQALGGGNEAHLLLGESFSISTQPGVRFWERQVNLAALPYLRDHRIHCELVFPGSGYVEMALAAARQVKADGAVLVEDMLFEHFLIVSEQEPPVLQTVFLMDGLERAKVSISCRDRDQWVRHASGTISWKNLSEESRPITEYLATVKQRCTTHATQSHHYQRMSDLGLEYGPCFQGVQDLWSGERETLARVTVPQAVAQQLALYQLHPAWLDACIQPAVSGITNTGTDLFVPVGIDRLEVYRLPDESVWVHLTFEPGETQITAELVVLSLDGQTIVRARGVRIQRLAASSPERKLAQEQWLYEVQWRRRARPPADPALKSASPTSLICVKQGERGATVCAALRQGGGRWVQVEVGDRYRQVDADHYQIDPSDAQGYQTLLREAFGDTGCAAIVHMWSLDATADEPLSAERLAHEQRLAGQSVLHLAQSAVRVGWRRPPRLWLVTCGSQAVTAADTAIAVSQAPLWGLGQAILREHPELACTRIDLSASVNVSEIEGLVKEIQTGVREEQVALRDRDRYVARLVHGSWAAAEAQKELRIVQTGTYLITGGLSGLGLAAAESLVTRGARNLVLLGRHTPDEAASQTIGRLRAAGAQVLTAQVDVSRYDQVTAVVAAIRRNGPPLLGVLHCAAVIDDGILLEQNWERFQRVMAPKVYGAWNLHLATLAEPLDFFAMYSSVASLLGASGQASYVAANAFVDALAQYRRRAGRCGLSINWGAFAGAGMGAQRPARLQQLADAGMQSLTTEEGNHVLFRLLSGSHIQVGVIKLDLRQWLAANPALADSPYWSDLVNQHGRGLRAEQTPKMEWLAMLLAAEPEEQTQLLTQYLIEQLGHVLRLPAAKVEPELPLLQLGLDSLMAVEMRNRVNADLRVRVPIQYFLTGASATRLVSYVREQLLRATAAAEDSEEIEEGAV